MKKDIRFLVTNICNYNCSFCHAEGVDRNIPQHELRVNDYITLFKIYSDIENWNGVTLSGGEPLLFHDVDTLVKKLYEENARIKIVTNGSFLHKYQSLMKYIRRINVSIHTMNQTIYSNIIGRESENLSIVKNNLQTIRNLYPNLEIRLNVTPCKENNWDIKEFKKLIDYSKQISASIKLTELFPNNQKNCVTIKTLRDQLIDIGYVNYPTSGRTELYKNGDHQVFLTQCTCSRAILTESPIEYCKKHHDLYVNHDATFPICRLSQEYIDFWEEIRSNDLNALRLKMKLAQKKISSELCNEQLKRIYF